MWLALLGTVLYIRRAPLWAVPAILTFAALVWVNGSAHDWSSGWAFGGRRLTSALAALAPGFALMLAWFRRHPFALIVPAILGVVGWNGLLMTQYTRHMIPRDETVRFDTLIRQQVDLYLKPPYWYPFAFPANVWFAWREDLPVDRYDLLGSEPLRREMYLPLNDWGARFLLDGWTSGGGDSFGLRHFLNAPSGTILVPRDPSPDAAFSLDVEARAEGVGSGGTTVLDVAVNGRSFGDIVLTIGAAAPTRRVFSTPLGAKVWRHGYNRVTISRQNVPAGAFVIVYALRMSALAQSQGRQP